MTGRAVADQAPGVVLVIGARSKTGRELVRRLLRRGDHVRVLARHLPQTSESAEVESVRGDLDDGHSLDAAMAGATAAFLLSSAGPDQVEQHGRAFEAAQRQGVRHLVRSSILGADPSSQCLLRRQNGIADERLRSCEVPWTVLAPNYYQQNVPDVVLPSIGAGGELFAPAGEARLSMVDTADVAAAACAVLDRPEHHGATYALCGSSALDHDEVAALLGERLGRHIRYVDVPSDATRDALLAAGAPPWRAQAVTDLYDDYRRSGPDGYAAQTPPDLSALLGRSPRTLPELLDERLGVRPS